jgi:hypothetical protein
MRQIPILSNSTAEPSGGSGVPETRRGGSLIRPSSYRLTAMRLNMNTLYENTFGNLARTSAASSGEVCATAGKVSIRS